MAGHFDTPFAAADWLRTEANYQAHPRPTTPGMIRQRVEQLQEIAGMLAPHPRHEQGGQVLSGADFHGRQRRFSR